MQFKTYADKFYAHHFIALDNSDIIYLVLIYDYCEPRMAWPPSLAVSVSRYRHTWVDSWVGTNFTFFFFFFFFYAFYAELLHTSYMIL